MLHDLVDQDVTTACLTDVGAEHLPQRRVKHVGSRMVAGRVLPADTVDVAIDGVADLDTLAIADLIDAIEQDREPVSSARDAVAALEMILGAYEAQISGARVAMPMARREHPLDAWQARENAR